MNRHGYFKLPIVSRNKDTLITRASCILNFMLIIGKATNIPKACVTSGKCLDSKSHEGKENILDQEDYVFDVFQNPIPPISYLTLIR